MIFHVKELSPQQLEQLVRSSHKMVERLQNALNHPEAQKIIEIVTDPEALKAMEDLAKAENWQRTLIIQGAFLIGFGIFRSILGVGSSFLKKLFHRLWTFFFYWAMSLYIIPVSLLGEPYIRLLSALSKGIKQQYF